MSIETVLTEPLLLMSAFGVFMIVTGIAAVAFLKIPEKNQKRKH